MFFTEVCVCVGGGANQQDSATFTMEFFKLLWASLRPDQVWRYDDTS